MNFLLIASILLLVPLALAGVTPKTEIKLIFYKGTVITEQDEGTVASYRDNLFDATVVMDFGSYGALNLSDSRFNSVREAQFRFVVELQVFPEGYGFDSFEVSSASLRPLVTINQCENCNKSILIREPHREERMQIEKFEKNRKEMDKTFKVISRDGRLISKSHSMIKLAVDDASPELTVQAWPRFLDDSMARISRPAGKPFVVEGSHETNCYPLPVFGLKVTKCSGQILVRGVTNQDYK